MGEPKADRDVSALKNLLARPSIETIEKEVESTDGIDPKLKKQISLFLSRRYSGKKLKEIGNYFGISESGVSQAGRRIAAKIDTDKRFREKIQELENRIKE